MELVWFVWLAVVTVGLVYVALRGKPKSSVQSGQETTSSQRVLECFQYYSLVKFNPFADTGGEQSFVLALLNGHKTGIIITSLHGRGVTRFYAKKIVNGLSDQELSGEEKQALNKALMLRDE